MFLRNKVKGMIDDMGLSIQDASKQCGLSRSSFGRVYRDEINAINFDTICAMCSGLDAEIGDLFEYIPEHRMTAEDYVSLQKRSVKVARRYEERSNYMENTIVERAIELAKSEQMEEILDERAGSVLETDGY